MGCSNVEGQTESEIRPEKHEHVEALTEEIVVSETVVHQEASVTPEQAEPAVKIYPLPDTTMDNLNDATLSISLEEGDDIRRIRFHHPCNDGAIAQQNNLLGRQPFFVVEIRTVI